MASATWVRFHSLPESKRYPEDQAEEDQVVFRHLTLLKELMSSRSDFTNQLWVVTAGWSRSCQPAERDADLISAFPNATYCKTVLQDDSEPDDPAYTHLYLGTTTLDGADLRDLLVLVCHDGTAGVILCPPSLDWLYHPYDGGVDVIASDRTSREHLRVKYSDWLSRHPQGL